MVTVVVSVRVVMWVRVSVAVWVVVWVTVVGTVIVFMGPRCWRARIPPRTTRSTITAAQSALSPRLVKTNT